jgi:AcrR family transcriptional regulator
MSPREHNPRGSGDQLRADLVRAATDLLVSPQKLSAPSLRAIARECGVAPSAVYLHFTSQDELLLAVIEAQYDELREALRAADRPRAAPLTRLQAMARTYVEWGIAHPGAYQLLFESADALPDDVTATGPGSDLIDAVAGLLHAHGVRRADECARLAMRLWVSLHGLASVRIHKPMAPWSSTAAADATAIVTSLVPAGPAKAR